MTNAIKFSLGMIDRTVKVSPETERIGKRLHRKYGPVKDPCVASCAVFFDIESEEFSFDTKTYMNYGLTGERSAGARWTFPGYMEFIILDHKYVNILAQGIKSIKRNNKEISLEDFLKEVTSKGNALNPLKGQKDEEKKTESWIQNMVSQNFISLDFDERLFIKIIEDHRFDDAFDHIKFYK